jgi:hypothetical protein
MAYHSGGSSMKEDKPKKTMGKMTDKQKADLKKHMDKHKDKMTPTEMKRHCMQMMSRMRKGMSVAKAHKDITGK